MIDDCNHCRTEYDTGGGQYCPTCGHTQGTVACSDGYGEHEAVSRIKANREHSRACKRVFDHLCHGVEHDLTRDDWLGVLRETDGLAIELCSPHQRYFVTESGELGEMVGIQRKGSTVNHYDSESDYVVSLMEYHTAIPVMINEVPAIDT